MKISDLLGEGWEPDEHPGATTDPAVAYRPTAPPPSVVSVPPAVADPASGEPVEVASPDVITSLASWAPAPERRDPELSAEPVTARAQLADLAAGLALPVSAPPVEPEAVDAPDELAELSLVVDDLLPDARKRKGSARGPSRSGSRRRGR